MISKVQWQYDINQHGWKGWYYRHKLYGTLEHSSGIRPQLPVYNAKEIESRALGLIKEVIDEKFSR